MVIMEENQGYAATLGSCGSGSPDPYLCSLASTYASATAWYGVEHPSQPNYVDIASGGNQGCTSDFCVPASAYSAPDLGGQLSSAGIPWTAYMESMPSACYTGNQSGEYVLKHNPFVVFQADMPPNACHIQPYPGATGLVAALDSSSAPDFVWITPNLNDDMHDGTIQQADQWLQTDLAGVLTSSWFRANGTVLITMDEGTDNSGCCGGAAGGQVPMVVISSNAKGRGNFATPGDHYGTLRTIEEAYGLARLGAAANSANGDLSSLLG
jgi:acid phosphatase